MYMSAYQFRSLDRSVTLASLHPSLEQNQDQDQDLDLDLDRRWMCLPWCVDRTAPADAPRVVVPHRPDAAHTLSFATYLDRCAGVAKTLSSSSSSSPDQADRRKLSAAERRSVFGKLSRSAFLSESIKRLCPAMLVHQTCLPDQMRIDPFGNVVFQSIVPFGDSPFAWHVDHIIPFSRGGTCAPENFIGLQRDANIVKYTRTLGECLHAPILTYWGDRGLCDDICGNRDSDNDSDDPLIAHTRDLLVYACDNFPPTTYTYGFSVPMLVAVLLYARRCSAAWPILERQCLETCLAWFVLTGLAPGTGTGTETRTGTATQRTAALTDTLSTPWVKWHVRAPRLAVRRRPAPDNAPSIWETMARDILEYIILQSELRRGHGGFCTLTQTVTRSLATDAATTGFDKTMQGTVPVFVCAPPAVMRAPSTANQTRLVARLAAGRPWFLLHTILSKPYAVGLCRPDDNNDDDDDTNDVYVPLVWIACVADRLPCPTAGDGRHDNEDNTRKPAAIATHVYMWFSIGAFVVTVLAIMVRWYMLYDE